MSAEFKAFLSHLPAAAGYCVNCLSDIYGRPPKAILSYLYAAGVQGRAAECGNCNNYRLVFKS